MTDLSDLDGLIPAHVGDALHYLAAHTPGDTAIVNIGAYKGKSTAYLAQGAKDGDGAPVYAVDPWDLPGNPAGKFGFDDPAIREAFESQLRSVRLWSRVTPIQAFAADAARDWDGPPVGLLFVDGDHAEASVRADVAAWAPHLAADHLIVLDDLDTPRNPGVRVVADELVGYGWTLEVAADRLGVLHP